MNEESLFAEALGKKGEARAAFLDERCLGDADLRRRLDALLLAHDHPHPFLDAVAPPPGATVDVQPTGERPGTVIGPYKLLEQIGEGGFGVVFLAEQTRPVRRRVALKVLKPGMDTRHVVARFEAERQALALMDHPNIARVFDGGATESGRPYFVMEMVKGAPITEFCDQQQLTPRRRLELFLPVCQAVQHAHQKGIIHRDLKPSNILVSRHDTTAVPKVIDFGVAKALGQTLTDKTLFTGVAQMVGTPLYMSPEQAGMSDLDADTRSDIYSLGVLLYELLTGTTPFRKERFKKAGYDEIRRIIREEDPPKPSTRLSESKDTLVAVSARRHTEPEKLTKLVRGELDWIVMKALEKDRNRRYETATSFALDVGRYLADEPVLACPPSGGYRLRKFLQRHRGEALAAGLVLLALVGGVIGTSVGLVRAMQARGAEARRAEGEQRARETAEKRFDQVREGIDALSSIFKDLDPLAEQKEGKPLRAILADRLDGPAAALEGEAVGDPLLVADLQDRLGQAYLGLGQPAKAEALFARALATCQAHLGADHRTTLERMHNLATAYKRGGKLNEAIALFEKVRDAKVQAHGADDPSTLRTLSGLGGTYWLVGRLPEAIALLEKVRDADVKRYGAGDPRTLATLNNLAGAYANDRRYAEAIALQEEVLAAWVKKHGEGHALSIGAMNNLAQSYWNTFKMRRAFALLDKARDTAVRSLGPLHPQTLMVLSQLAFMHRGNGNLTEAIALGEQVLERQVLTLGADHFDTLTTQHNLALAYQKAGKLDKALPLFQQAAAGVEKLRFAHGDAGGILLNLAGCHERLKQYAEAEAWQRKWLDVVKARGAPRPHETSKALGGLASNLLRQNKHADAEPLLRECLAIQQEKEPEKWETFLTRARLGAALLGQKKYADAEPHLVKGYEGMSGWAERLGPSHAAFTRKHLTEALEGLVRLYDAWGKPDEAAKWRKELAAHTRSAE